MSGAEREAQRVAGRALTELQRDAARHPRRSSVLPQIAASVSTLVVSWDDDALMNDSVDSDAFVIPSNIGSATAG